MTLEEFEKQFECAPPYTQDELDFYIYQTRQDYALNQASQHYYARQNNWKPKQYNNKPSNQGKYQKPARPLRG